MTDQKEKACNCCICKKESPDGYWYSDGPEEYIDVDITSYLVKKASIKLSPIKEIDLWKEEKYRSISGDICGATYSYRMCPRCFDKHIVEYLEEKFKIKPEKVEW